MKLLSLLSYLFAIVSCGQVSPDKTGLEGKSLPDLSILLPDSSTYYNTKTIPKNKPVVLLYFSPNCPFCRAQTEDIVDKIKSLKDIQFVFITDQDFKGMKSFNKEFNLDKYPNVKTGFDTSYFIPKYFGAMAVPYLAIYGKDQKLNSSFMGKMYPKQIKIIAEQ
jgi:thiol-disulfide isomerase/thioredoxin